MSGKPTEIMVYGIIGADVTSAQVTNRLGALGDDAALSVRINSRGGDVFEGVAILNALRGHNGQVTTIVDGIAASAASFIAMGGDEIVMNRNSQMMIHGGRVPSAAGGMDELRKLADNLERINANMASIYAEKAGGSAADWLTAMAAETWYSAEEAVAAGLADRVEAAAPRDGAEIAASLDLSIFNYAGRANAPAPPQISSAAPAEVHQGKEHTVPTLHEGLAERLGIAADADDETILAAVDEALTERAADDGNDDGDGADAPTQPVEPTLEQAQQVAAQFGATVISTTVLTSLQAQAQAGADARSQQVRESHEREIAAAINEGRIDPASRESFLAYFDADAEGARRALAKIAPNTVPVTELGHGITNEAASEDDLIYSSLFGKDA